MLKNEIRIIRDQHSIEYITNSDNSISMTEYKVAQGLQGNGIIKGLKALHNGRDKLIYKISDLDSLNSVLSEAEAAGINNICDKIICIKDEVNSSGFLQAERLDWNIDRIFVDNAFENVYMIYLPLNLEINEPWELLYKKLIKNIYEIRPDLEDSRPEKAEKKDYPEECPEKKDTTPPKNKKGIFSKFFKEKSREKIKAEKNIIEIEESGGTELLDSIFIPSVVISSVNAPQRIEKVVNKEEYVIGKNPDYTDFTIEFSKAVSNKHCLIYCRNGINYIKDLKSLNGTFVNGIRLEQNEERRINPGDKIKLANCEFAIKSV